MGHKQPATPIQTDNAMAEAVINGKVQPKRTKAMDMRFHWLRDRECQQQFRIYWKPGKLNYADYWTKHHPAKHHQQVRREFITPHLIIEMLRMEQNKHSAAAACTQSTRRGCDDPSKCHSRSLRTEPPVDAATCACDEHIHMALMEWINSIVA